MSEAERPGGDDVLANRLETLFTAAKGPAPAVPPPPGEMPEAAPNLQDRSAGTVLPEVEVVRLIRYLDAQLELTRKEAREGREAVLAAVTALYDWLDTFAQWQASRFDRLDQMATEVLRATATDPEEGARSPG